LAKSAMSIRWYAWARIKGDDPSASPCHRGWLTNAFVLSSSIACCYHPTK